MQVEGRRQEGKERKKAQRQRVEAWGIFRNYDSSLIEPNIVEEEKGVNSLIRALRDG
ncbi:MAG: hypothetical protein SWH54_08755 [Thermodesulfobacteriota bacterium]|nr:hypothetical protein [Thermodesulfobacteriota bacterium]